MADISSQIYALSPDIRYVALYRNGDLVISQRGDVSEASDEGSDKFEELLVNPTLLKLTQQRGNIDCGGASFVVVGYGNFLQLVVALPNGHASICFEKSTNPIEYVEAITKACCNDGS